MYHIYSLLDPTTKTIRYIGKTCRSLEERLSAHIWEQSNDSMFRWIKKLKKNKLVPIIESLETCESDKEAAAREKYYISLYKEKGHQLLNCVHFKKGVTNANRLRLIISGIFYYIPLFSLIYIFINNWYFDLGFSGVMLLIFFVPVIFFPQRIHYYKS